MESNDIKEIINVSNEIKESEGKSKVVSSFKELGNIIHRYSLWMLVASLIGVGVGIKTSQFYFNSKMIEATQVGGIVFKGKIYAIIPK